MSLRTGVDMGSPATSYVAARARICTLVIGNYNDGYRDGTNFGEEDGFRRGFYAGGFAGQRAIEEDAFDDGRRSGFVSGLSAGAASVVIDANPPTITIISPTPGVAPGQPGGFSADRRVAIVTPIVLQINDVAPGVSYICVTVKMSVPGVTGDIAEEVVYRRGNFRGRHVLGSFVTTAGNQLTLTCYREGGWVGKYLTFDVDALDGVGNLAS